jgi:hypothetical protein
MPAINSHSARVLFAAAVAPIIPGVLLLFLAAISGKFSEGIWWLKLSALVGYPAMFVLGLPIHLLLHRIGWSRLPIYIFVGAAIGITCTLVILESTMVKNTNLHVAHSWLPFAGLCLLASVFGALVGSSFWMLAKASADGSKSNRVSASDDTIR